MSYRYDPDLEFLQNCSNDDLEKLANYLNLKDYKNKNTPWIYIAEDIQRLGETSLQDYFLNGSVYYKDMLIDICKKLKINFNSNYSTEKIESCLLDEIKKNSIVYSDFQSELYKQIMPSCIQIAYIRNKYNNSVNTH